MRRAALVVAALLLAACSNDAARGSTEPSGSQAAILTRLVDCPRFTVTSEPVPDGLPALTFPCLVGDSMLTLGGPLGRPMVLNLWASWCGPCREELPVFQRLYTAAAERVFVVGLVQRDTMASSAAYAAELDLSFPSALDDTGEFLTAVGINSLPLTYFVRADGSLAYRRVGPIASYQELTALVTEHLDVTVS